MRLRLLIGTLLAASVCSATAAAQAPDPSYVHAHRGGPTLGGVHTFGEETLSAFRNAHLALGSVLEVDTKLTAEGVPVVIHDATLDRTTPCTGRVDARSLRELAGCPVDVLGSPGSSLGGVRSAQTEPIATLEQVLDFARDAGARVNLEIKNVPTEPDFDESGDFAEKVLDVVEATRFPVDRLIVQAFWPPSLDAAERRLPGVQTALLTLAQMNDGGIAFAAGRGYEWVSPAWPVSSGYVARAHQAGRKVVPYTLNTAGDVESAREAGVDAVISDDPLMARRALGIPDPVFPDTEGPVTTLRFARLASDAHRSPTVRLRWKATDASALAGHQAEIRRAGTRTWRRLSLGARTSVRFRGAAGATYVLRVRAQDFFGNLGRYASRAFVIPRDQGALALSPGWRRLARARAWMKAVAQADGPGATGSLRFSGRRVRLIGPRLRSGGRLEIRLDGRRRVVSVRGAGERRVLFDSRGLRRGRHTLRIRALGGGPVAVDAVATS